MGALASQRRRRSQAIAVYCYSRQATSVAWTAGGGYGARALRLSSCSYSRQAKAAIWRPPRVETQKSLACALPYRTAAGPSPVLCGQHARQHYRPRAEASRRDMQNSLACAKDFCVPIEELLAHPQVGLCAHPSKSAVGPSPALCGQLGGRLVGRAGTLKSLVFALPRRIAVGPSSVLCGQHARHHHAPRGRRGLPVSAPPDPGR